jgi:hypothetical protein
MKTNMKVVVLIGLSALAVSQASANLVVNGDFSAGDTGFTSDYGDGTGSQNSLLTFGLNQGAGYYAVGTTPSYYNQNWTYGPTSVTGDPSAGMLIVNGAPTGGPTTVWQGTLSSPLIAGQSYTFSVMVASLYPVSEPTLSFSIGSTPIGSTTLSGAGTWSTFTKSFVAGSGLPSFIDLNTELNGNDFVVSEISITPVPEPTTMIAGALLLLPFGASTLRILRRRTA